MTLPQLQGCHRALLAAADGTVASAKGKKPDVLARVEALRELERVRIQLVREGHAAATARLPAPVPDPAEQQDQGVTVLDRAQVILGRGRVNCLGRSADPGYKGNSRSLAETAPDALT